MKSFKDETFYTPEQVAEKLQLSLTTVYNLIRSQEITAIRVGKSFRIPESKLIQSIGIETPIIPKTVQIFIEKLKKAKFSGKIVDVILFGSYARGTPDDDSDIDLLLIHNDLSSSEREVLSRIEEEASKETDYLEEINLIKKSFVQWKFLEGENSGLYKRIASEGISLWKT